MARNVALAWLSARRVVVFDPFGLRELFQAQDRQLIRRWIRLRIEKKNCIPVKPKALIRDSVASHFHLNFDSVGFVTTIGVVIGSVWGGLWGSLNGLVV